MPVIKSNFRGSQQNLYTLTRKAWGYCLENIEAISKKMPTITPSYIADQLTKVDTAEALPNYYNRKEIPQEAHDDMMKAALAVTDEWQFLKGYTEAAYPKEQWKAKLESAGMTYYRDATRGGWDEVASLINGAKSFLDANEDVLKNKGGMPADFPQDFEALAKAFTDLRTLYFGKEDLMETRTAEKKAADAAILETLKPMLKMGSRIFKNDPDKRDKFSYTKLLKMVRGNDESGLKGKFTDAATKKPLGKVNIRAIDTDYAAVSGEDGRYFLAMAKGLYTIEVSAPGYQTVVIKDRKIDVGTKHNFSLALEAVPTSVLTKEILNNLVSKSVTPMQAATNGELV